MINLPIVTVSEANLREHWTKKAKRHRAQREIIYSYWNREKPEMQLPCSITLTRIAPRKLDSDNLIFALKWVRDCLASLLVPGLRPGRADDDPRIIWNYKQRKGNPKEYLVSIEISQ